MIEFYNPLIITPRLMVGVKLGKDVFISIQEEKIDNEGRIIYHYYIDNSTKNYDNNDLKSGVNCGNIQEGLCSLLDFIGAFLESYPNGENADLFPNWLYDVLSPYQDEISILSYDLQENNYINQE